MSLKYTSTNRIKFTDISDKYDVSRVVRGKISELHAKLITYVVSHFRNSNQYKQQVVDALNIITYAVYANDPLPFNWSAKDPFNNMPQIEESLLQETLGDVYLTVDGVEWDIEPSYNDSVDIFTKYASVQSSSAVSSSKQKSVKPTQSFSSPLGVTKPTMKQDLYIQSPVVPQIDYSKVWKTGLLILLLILLDTA